jgi:hypothetical protein
LNSGGLKRFVIAHSAVDKEAKPEASSALFRTRNRFVPARSTSDEKEKSQEAIRCCGRDAVVNKPYKPLGSMQSVLSLEIVKKKNADSEMDDIMLNPSAGRRRKREELENGSVIRLKRSSNNAHDTREEAHGEKTSKAGAGTSKQERMHGKSAPGEIDLAKELWGLRQTQHRKAAGRHAFGYNEIRQILKESSKRISNVKAGGSVLDLVEKSDAIDSAKWASEMTIQKMQHEREVREIAQAALRASHSNGVSQHSNQSSHEGDYGDSDPTVKERAFGGGVEATMTPRKPDGAGRPHFADSSPAVAHRKVRVVDRLKHEFAQIHSKHKKEQGRREVEIIAGKPPKMLSRRQETKPSLKRQETKSHAMFSKAGKRQETRANVLSRAKSKSKLAGGPSGGLSLALLSPKKAGEKEQQARSASIVQAEVVIGAAGEAKGSLKDAGVRAIMLTEKQRKRLPAYVLNFPRRDEKVKTRQQLVETLASGKPVDPALLLSAQIGRAHV